MLLVVFQHVGLKVFLHHGICLQLMSTLGVSFADNGVGSITRKRVEKIAVSHFRCRKTETLISTGLSLRRDALLWTLDLQDDHKLLESSSPHATRSSIAQITNSLFIFFPSLPQSLS